MIHSTAGGKLKDYNYYDYAKVAMLEGEKADSILWFISPFPELKVDDVVLVSSRFSINGEKAKVLKVDKNVSEQNFPIPAKRMQRILKIL